MLRLVKIDSAELKEIECIKLDFRWIMPRQLTILGD